MVLMAAVSREWWIDELGLREKRPPAFFRSIADIDGLRVAHPQAHSMRRAWKEMGLDGILCIDNTPVVYFSATRQFDEASARVLHRRAWNQGIAPLLIFVTDSAIRVYSTLALPPKPQEELDAGSRLVQILDRTTHALSIRTLAQRIELGDIFRDEKRCFDPERRVDRHLLANLAHARDLLAQVGSEPLPSTIIHALLGRVIFTSYLTDREVIGTDYFARCGARNCGNLHDLLAHRSAREAKDLLYAVFAKLKQDFNGDLFDADLATEAQRVTAQHVDVVRRFLTDETLATGQLSLGFSTYDYRFIPIETISAIYERFLHAEDAAGRRATGVYYTPRFLAEIVLDLALENTKSLLDRRFLDPACGSGIFLVGLFNRLAEEWRLRHPGADNLTRAAALMDILTTKIYGVDVSETACRIASLSLYLALLDQLSPRDIHDLQNKGQCLPGLVATRMRAGSTATGRNIICADFFSPDLALPAEGFDLVVGNPPWARAKGAQATAETWCELNQLPMAQRQISYAFVWKAGRHVRNGGCVTLVLPAATLFNHQERALRFQEAFLKSRKVEVILNLSDLVFFLFEGAERPAIVVRFREERPDASARVPYLVPKASDETLRAELLSVAAIDRTELRLSELLRDLARGVPLAWKEAMWATSRGRKCLDRLREYPSLASRLREQGGRWEFGEGFNLLGKGKSIERPLLRTLRFLPTASVGRYVVSERQLKERPRALNPRYIGKEEIFRAPHVVFPHGVSRTGETLKVAYCRFDCSFEHSLRGIHGPQEDEDALRFLACALSSPLALYFFFHTAANWGTERAKIHLEEYARFPFPSADTRERRQILAEAVAIHRDLEAEQEVNPLAASSLEKKASVLDGLVYSYYEVDDAERLLIEDTVAIWIPSATPTRGVDSIPSVTRSSQAERGRYARVLVQTLDGWIKRRGSSLSCQVLVSPRSDLGVVRLGVEEGVGIRIEGEQASSAELDRALGRVRRAVPAGNRSLRNIRDVKVFDGPDLYAIKPLARRYWTDTQALNDADEIMGTILQAMRGPR
jgi:hypothetical protein